jgi:hypothetical protein
MHVSRQLSIEAQYGVLAVHGSVARHSLPICNVSVQSADFAGGIAPRRKPLEFRPEPCLRCT